MSKTKLTISILAILFIVLFAMPVFAGSEIKFIPSTTIPGSDFVKDSPININSGSLGQYIIAIYNYGIGLVSVLAVVMIMFGGYKRIFAAGNAGAIGEANSTIISALVGLILALGSFMLLNTINPALTTFKPLYAPAPKIGSCPTIVRDCSMINDFFGYVDQENSTQAAVSDAVKYYAKKFDFIDDEGDFKDNYSQAALKQAMCASEDVQASCGIYPGMCIVNNNACQSIININCSSDADCLNIKPNTLCQTQTNQCSFGLRNSICRDVGECNDGLNCVDNRCFSLGVEGDTCDSNAECAPGLVCTDEAGYQDKCRPQPEECNVDADCRSLDGWEDNSNADCNNDSYFDKKMCDCDDDDACSANYRCFDTKNGANDLCLPASTS
ncbi:hypothetical protein ISR92_02335 [Patescibacteria group bacterium]|nr:hypothetical protein [Patescibacteria group bacterium]